MINRPFNEDDLHSFCHDGVTGVEQKLARIVLENRATLKRLRVTVSCLSRQIVSPKDNVFSEMLNEIDGKEVGWLGQGSLELSTGILGQFGGLKEVDVRDRVHRLHGLCAEWGDSVEQIIDTGTIQAAWVITQTHGPDGILHECCAGKFCHA